MSHVRELVVSPKAVMWMRLGRPSEAERDALMAVLLALKTETLRELALFELAPAGSVIGYRIGSMEPPTYRIDVGRFRIHYQFDEESVQVGYIGAY